MKNRGLGRGLSALIPGAAEAEGILEIPLEELAENPFQPRQDYERESLIELAESIRQNGVIQPVTVCRRGEGYLLITGARRKKAAKIAGLKTLPAYVLDIKSDAELLELALVENLQREDLNPLELAAGYQRLIDECGMSQEEVAAKVGKQRSTITNTIRLLKLPDTIKEGLRNDKITMGHARALLAVEDEELQLALYHRTLREGINVRQLEKLASRSDILRRKKTAQIAKPPYVVDFENRLRTLYATKVNITPRRRGGVIEINYFSEDELERLMEIMESRNNSDF